MAVKLHHGDCLEILPTLDASSVDAVVTDPPYGLRFMGKRWDATVPSAQTWVECLRVLKPGGHLLSFAGTRTYHRIACGLEAAGFDIRDMIAWVYGSGFPKSLDVSKAIDKVAGAKREVIGINHIGGGHTSSGFKNDWPSQGNGRGGAPITAPATDAAREWDGWGTALKPAMEPIAVARKPFTGTVADNVLEHGTGGVNVDGCRIETNGRPLIKQRGESAGTQHTTYGKRYEGSRHVGETTLGRWPANLIHDGSDEVTALFPETTSGGGDKRGGCEFFMGGDKREEPTGHTINSGSAARFFYCAKASKAERDAGLEGFEAVGSRPLGLSQWEGQTNGSGERMGPSKPARNTHPTVKPIALMRYLVRLVTPPGGAALDPFMGSGSTGVAAVLEGFDFIGVELEDAYLEIARARIERAQQQGQLDFVKTGEA